MFLKHCAGFEQWKSVIDEMKELSWACITPRGSLRQFTLERHPLLGWQESALSQAWILGQSHFDLRDLPAPMVRINRITVKWLQAYFDQGQALWPMPLRVEGLLPSLRALLPGDREACCPHSWMDQLPANMDLAIQRIFGKLGIEREEYQDFITLVLTTLPGWSSYIHSLGDREYPAIRDEYLVFRLVLMQRLWPEARKILDWNQDTLRRVQQNFLPTSVVSDVTDSLAQRALPCPTYSASPSIQGQWVFCMDVRSEPLRRALEQHNSHETFSCSGAFGLPPLANYTTRKRRYFRRRQGYPLIQPLFFPFYGIIGWMMGVWMVARSLFPSTMGHLMVKFGQYFSRRSRRKVDEYQAPLGHYVRVAHTVLSTIGLTKKFAPLVILCGHKSTVQNHAFSSAWQCGACHGQSGVLQGDALARILNNPRVRMRLRKQGIKIPRSTHFIAAEWDTSTFCVNLRTPMHKTPLCVRDTYRQVVRDLQKVNVCSQLKTLRKKTRPYDWSTTRPEEGLARNSSLFIGPRSWTRGLDLQGRAFLHSYAWDQDPEGDILQNILNGPMIMAQGINLHYLFLTLAPHIFGAGSQTTINITGKLGAMQGNAGDLRWGMPFQNVFGPRTQALHSSRILTVAVLAPIDLLRSVIDKEPKLQNAIKHRWLHMICRDPQTSRCWQANLELNWIENLS